MAVGPRTITALAMLLLFAAGIVFLQIFLSKRESRWPGLVLPGLAFLLSLLYVLSAADTGSVSGNILLVLAVLLAGNIPTLVLLAIFWAVREKRRVKAQMDKMQSGDL